MRSNLSEIAGKIGQMIDLRPGDLTLDIGCNDGTLLDSYPTRGLDKLGIDPG